MYANTARLRKRGLLALASTGVVLSSFLPVAPAFGAGTGTTPVPVASPPTHPFTIFPSRELVDVEGVSADQTLKVELIRNGRVVSATSGLVPDASGLVEINHVGANCWTGVTPEIRTGDTVRATASDADGSVAWIDEATTANVTAQKAVQTAPDTVQVHGTAALHDGKPIPVDQIEQRLVSSTSQPFHKTRKQDLRADSSASMAGTLAYDPVDPAANPLGTNWTATYSGLDASDVQLALGVESQGIWLGRSPLAGAELTIFEVGSGDPPGPATPDCTARLEPIDTAAPSTPTATATPRDTAREVTVNWQPSTDNSYVYGYRVLRDGTPIAAVAGTTTSYVDSDVAPGNHTYAVEAYDSASPTGPGTTDAQRITAGFGRPYGNTSPRSADVPVTLNDVQPPSTPTNLVGTNPAGTNNARLVFDPSTDDSGSVAKYRVYRNGVLLPNAVPTLNGNGKLVYVDNKLTPNTSYRYTVDAVDAAGNASARSEEMTVSIGADAEAPTAPETVTTSVPDIHGKDVVVTWAAARDNLGVTGYGIYRDGTRVGSVSGSTLTFRDAGLPAGTYKYRVDAVDSAGNRSDRAPTPASSAVIANDPPGSGHTVIAYPARDFVEGDGYVGEGPVVVEVIRNGTVVDRTQPIQPDANGLVEVNHAGPGCWNLTTPDIRPGDVVRITNAAGIADQTTVTNVVTERPIQTAADTVVVHGTARSDAGAPLPLDQLESRLIADTEFRANGRKQLRAAGDGTIAYDAAGSTAWTATYSGLSSADVTRALNGEAVINWLGRTPLANSELTIAENGPGTDGGPAAGACTAPLEPGVPQLNWTTDRLAFGVQTTVPASTTTKTVTLSNPGTVPVQLSKVYLGGANPGAFTVDRSKLPATLAPGSSGKVDVTFSPKVVGTRSATLNFVDNAANTSFQTIDLTGSGVNSSAPSTPGRPDATLQSSGPIGSDSETVNLSWTESTGPVMSYQVQVSVAGGAFTDVTPQPAAAQLDPETDEVVAPAQASLSLPVRFGQNTRFQVRACNGSACSAWATAPAFNLAALQEGNKSAVSYGGVWSTQAVPGASGGSVSFSSTAGTKALLKTTGTGVQVISTLGPNRGNAEVWVDKVRVGTVNLYSSTVQPSTVIFTKVGLANATHEVELRPLGTHGAGSTGNRVDLDAFIALQ